MSEQVKTNMPSLNRDDLFGHVEGNSFVNTILSSRRLLVVLFMLIIFASAARPVKDPDFYWHLKTGQYLVETRTIPTVDMFSWSKFGSEWVTHEWLSEVIMVDASRDTVDELAGSSERVQQSTELLGERIESTSQAVADMRRQSWRVL